mmetsp:Transcript_36835/g.85623  ORF Transcript_36835/g.85623 Transcript_36835/m.85623 type:complete len:253 (-) Transcript_36835:283-1041(-)
MVRRRGFRSGQFDHQNKVGGVPCGAERPATCSGTIHGRIEGRVRLELGGLHRLEPDDGHGEEELLRERLGQLADGLVPAGALEEEALDVNAVVGGAGQLVLLHHLKVKGDRVDRNGLLPRKVLQRPGEEGVGEEEAPDPERRGLALVDPVLEEAEACEEVVDVGAEGFEAGVAHPLPHGRDFADGERLGHLLQVARHDHQPLDGLAEVLQGRPHHRGELVVPDELLLQHRVHALPVLDRVLGVGRLAVEVAG